MVWYESDWGPSCLPNIMGCEEFETVPRHCVEKVLAEKAPQFDSLLEVLELKMQHYRNERASRSEFKAVKQMENESMKEIFPKSTLFGRFGIFRKITHRKWPRFTWSNFGTTIRLPVPTKTLWRRDRPEFWRIFIKGARVRAYSENFWWKTGTTAVAFPGCEIERSRISRSLWEKGAISKTVRFKLFY